MAPKPFVKWVGGKSGLLPQLLPLVPKDYGTYFEPFVGGGAMFWALSPVTACLIDSNPELMAAYSAVAEELDAVIAALKEYARLYADAPEEHYERVRALNPKSLSTVEVAARFIFLNKSCYNGLYRVNLLGQFNAPMGKFKTPPTICDEENLRACSQELFGVRLLRSTYQAVIELAQPGDFVYLDPPYLPISKTSSFDTYQAGGFSEMEHRQLARVYRKLAERGVKVMLSNSSSPMVKELYQGFDIRTVMADRAINTHAEKRGAIPETVVLSYDPS